jgi:hypothetical protein
MVEFGFPSASSCWAPGHDVPNRAAVVMMVPLFDERGTAPGRGVAYGRGAGEVDPPVAPEVPDGPACLIFSNRISAASTQVRIDSPRSQTTPSRVSPLRRKKRAPPPIPERWCQPWSSSRRLRSSRYSRRSLHESSSSRSRSRPWACAAEADKANAAASNIALRIEHLPSIFCPARAAGEPGPGPVSSKMASTDCAERNACRASPRAFDVALGQLRKVVL